MLGWQWPFCHITLFKTHHLFHRRGAFIFLRYRWGNWGTESFDHLHKVQSLWNGSLAVSPSCVTNHRGHLAGLPLLRNIHSCKAGRLQPQSCFSCAESAELWGASRFTVVAKQQSIRAEIQVWILSLQSLQGDLAHYGLCGAKGCGLIRLKNSRGWDDALPEIAALVYGDFERDPQPQ